MGHIDLDLIKTTHQNAFEVGNYEHSKRNRWFLVRMLHGLHQPFGVGSSDSSRANTSHSQAIFGAAQALMPGGVSSPVRAFSRLAVSRSCSIG